VDGHRYADDSEPSWYTGSQYARSGESEVSGSHALRSTGTGAAGSGATGSWATGGGATGGGTTGSRATGGGSSYESGVHERPSGAFRLPEQRPSTYPLSDPTTTTGSHALPSEGYDSGRIPVRGPEYPTVRPTGASQAAARTDIPMPMAGPTSLVPPVGAHPRAAEAVYHSRRTASSFAVAAGMVVLMIPVVRLLLQATFTGTPSARNIVPSVLLTLGFALTGIGLFALAGNRPVNREAWLRPPVAYLPAGLLLLLAAGLAVA
jgi:hypothetical protein